MPPSPRSRRRSTEAQRLLDLLNALGSTTFRQFLWQRASELDLTYAQSQVLFYVGDHAGCHMGEVAKAFGVTLPAVTHSIDRLEQKQFVLRGDDPVDRRVYVLELTPQGKALVEELHTMRLRAVENVLARMAARALSTMAPAARAEARAFSTAARSACTVAPSAA